MSADESCDFCGGNCGQCGSSHRGGPPSMERMVSNLSRGGGYHPKPIYERAPPPAPSERVKPKWKLPTNWPHHVAALIGLALSGGILWALFELVERMK